MPPRPTHMRTMPGFILRSLLAFFVFSAVLHAEEPAPVSTPKPASGTTTSSAYVLTNTDRISITI